MTATHAALLRGVNVGKAKRIAMADLRRSVEASGLTEVRTLNSGNVTFRAAGRAGADAIGRRVEGAVKELGVTSRVTVLAAAEVEAILEGLPKAMQAMEPSRVLVAVPQAPSDLKKLSALAKEDWSPETLAIGTRAAYLGVPAGVTDSALVKAVGRELRDGVTTRNVATMRKLRALMQE